MVSKTENRVPGNLPYGFALEQPNVDYGMRSVHNYHVIGHVISQRILKSHNTIELHVKSVRPAPNNH